MTIKKLATLLLAASATMTVSAQQLSSSEALSRAQKFIQNVPSGRRAVKMLNARQLSLAYTGKQDDEVHYYVFNCQGYDGGFVIVGGDESAREVLGYCENGSFCYDSIPDNVRWWLENMEASISSGIAYTKTRQTADANEVTRSNIDDLVTAKWGQDDPFNRNIPCLGEGYEFVTGCTATAMSQIMYKWKYPTQGTGSKSYSLTYNTGEGLNSMTFSADFANTTYDFSNMVDDYSGSFTSANANAVATLMYHAGVAVNTIFNTSASSGSSADSFSASAALANYFGYDKSVKNELRKYYDDEEWEEMIYNELKNGRPVIYSGQSSSGGHAFVCHGYKDGAFAINWGWNGYYDGYYALTGTKALLPTSKDKELTSSQFCDNQVAVTGIMPDEGGETVLQFGEYEIGDLAMTGPTEWSRKSGKDTSVGVSMCFLNYGSTSATFLPGVMFRGKNTGRKYYVPAQTVTITTNQYMKMTTNCSTSQLEYNDIYEVIPVFRPASSTSDDDWQMESLVYGETIPTLTITGNAAHNIDFTLENSEMKVGDKMQIGYDKDYTGTLSCTSSDTNVATVDNNGEITAVGNGLAMISVVGSATADYNMTMKAFSIRVMSVVKAHPTFAISASTLRMGGTAKVTVSDGNYDGTLTASDYDEDIISVNNGVITAIGLGTTDITFTASETNLYHTAKVTYSLTVSDNGFMFASTPSFSNNNNPYEGDLSMSVSFKNKFNKAQDCKAYAVMKYQYGEYLYTRTQAFGAYDVEPGDVVDHTLDILSGITSRLTAGQTYTISFYLDEDCNEPANIASVSFTWCDTKNITLPVSSSQWATICLPFEAQLPDGLTAYECSNYSKGVLNLTKATSFECNTPYIINGAEGNYSFTGPDIKVTSNVVGKGMLVGILGSNVMLTANDYVLQHNDTETGFYRITSDMADKYAATQYRALLRLDKAGVTSLLLPASTDGILTGIADMNSDEGTAQVDEVYTLGGQKTDALRKGINIVRMSNGTVKKVIY